MAKTEECVIFRDRSNTLNFHKLFKSRSNGSSKESFRHHIREIAPVCKSQFKTFKEEDDEFAATLKKAESLDHNNCIWLSSGGPSSPSSSFLDNGFCYYTDLKLDAWFISLLSTKPGEILSTKVTFFDGSRVNPIEEASLVLDQRIVLEENLVFHENLEEKEVVSWLETSIENESSSISSITDHSSDCHSFSSCSDSDYSSEVVDLDEIGTDKPLFWPSEWTSDWDSDTKQDFFIMSPRKNTNKFDSDKGCNRRHLFGTHPKSSSNFDLKNTNKPSRFKNPQKTSTKMVPLDTEADFEAITESKVFNKTPVFWPSECASEWCSDTKLYFFVMSPRKDVSKSLNGKMDLEKGCSRRLEFNRCTEGEEVKPLTTKSVSKQKHRIVLEDLLLVDKLNVDGAIEEALGLDEFDGHEGLGSQEFSVLEIF